MPSERVQRRIDRLLDDAEQAADQHDWPKVLECVRGAIALDSQNADALAFKEMAVQAQGDASAEVDLPPETARTVQDSVDQPAAFASGRYTVSKFLGEGGKKKVYLAHDNTLDRDVAFALIKTEGLDETSRERVKREAQAMGRMGTHPCIMPIYDLGDESGQPFMVQPLMAGGDVEGLVEEAEGPLELDRALEIATQTAQGLSFAHGKGIVHRDLKPGNVWLDEDGAAKIGDFGLAVATDLSRLTVEKVIVGTVSYMPPEQATGGEVTPRADLYSLGAMLYEMCTGRVPFMGDDDIGIISQHINTPPVAPSWHNNQIPKTLDSLILRLLAKDPAERPSDADEVLAALEAVDLTAVEERDDESKGSLDAMAGGVFVGRHREMDQLKAIFEDVLSGKGRMVTLVGEPGIGKTRTAQELATYAGMRGAEVLWGRSYESGGAPPYWPWVQAIRSHVAATEPQALRDQLGATAPVISEIVSEVKAALTDVHPPPVIEDPESARFRLFDSISTFLKQVSSASPLVLMLEDLHWSDKPSLMLLEFVARELANSRILIVGNYRDMELNRRHPLSVTLGDLTRERLFERVVLRGLQRHDVERFIEIAAGIKPPAALVDTVHSQTEGNPLFVTETVRLLIQEGDIASGQSSRGGTTSWEIRIPEGVREVIGRRLDRLSERCNEVLTVAAVVGRQFRFDVLKTLVEDATDNQLLDAMDEALSARIIEELPNEVGLYQFTHAQMQETMIQELSHTRTVRMHARIAEALEEYYGDDAEEHAAELVEHFAEAETVLGTEKLVKYSLAAGDEALKAYGWDDALHYFGHVKTILEENSPDPRLAHALSGLARADRVMPELAKRQRALNNARQAFDMHVNLGNVSDAIEIAKLSHALGGLTGSLELAEKALELSVTDSVDQGWLLARYGVALDSETERYEESVEILNRALNIAEKHDDSLLKQRVEAHLIQRYCLHEDYSLAEANGPRVLELAKDSADRSNSIRTMSHLAWAAIGLGRLKWAAELIEFSLQAEEVNRSDMARGHRLYDLGAVARLKGDWKSVRETAKELQESIPSLSTLSELTTASVDVQLGQLEPVKIIFQAYKEVDQMPDGERRRLSLAYLGLQSSEQSGEPQIAEVERTIKIAGDRTRGTSRSHRLTTATLKAMLACLTHNEREAALAYDQISGREARVDLELLVSTDRVLGLTALFLGKTDQAISHFEAGAGFCERAGLLPEQAWTCTNYAELLFDRNALGDREKAIELQDEAISIATELGMKPLLERVLAKREILKA